MLRLSDDEDDRRITGVLCLVYTLQDEAFSVVDDDDDDDGEWIC